MPFRCARASLSKDIMSAEVTTEVIQSCESCILDFLKLESMSHLQSSAEDVPKNGTI